MLYQSAQDWRKTEHKRVLVFGMSGLGKTHLSNLLRASGQWFHYSIDYRIGTRYMGEYITDNAKAHAMKVPFLRDLLMTDSIYIGSNISFNNLTPVATYLGKPGDPARGGTSMADYIERQEQFRQAEISALMDTERFIKRAQALYGYPHFICDSGGSICEWVDPDNPDDPLLRALADQTLLVWIKGSDAHTQDLIARFDKAPKPMAYQPEFLSRVWAEYLSKNNLQEDDVDPDSFIRWTYAKALEHRQPRYEAMADWGVTVTADEVASVKTTTDFDDVIAAALERRA
ncbi:ATPase [Sulfitobacter sp. JL08]|uniref:ATPase n=1 Tax=Sulfitobacter sp. JL08 TaxID=2070369 RepID=UPI000E0B0CB8|nr:ATPase [Sulfitobacter sp. JL08]AXI54716.1 ATPase [Sulfitobacter sp. JL08]